VATTLASSARRRPEGEGETSERVDSSRDRRITARLESHPSPHIDHRTAPLAVAHSGSFTTGHSRPLQSGLLLPRTIDSRVSAVGSQNTDQCGKAGVVGACRYHFTSLRRRFLLTAIEIGADGEWPISQRRTALLCRM
jgi:hypothetical protein